MYFDIDSNQGCAGRHIGQSQAYLSDQLHYWWLFSEMIYYFNLCSSAMCIF